MIRFQTFFSLLVVFAVLLLNITIKAQDVHFTQPFAAPLNTNPALAGSNFDVKVFFNYKSQFRNIDKGYSNSAFTLLYPLFIKQNEKKLDLGFNFQNHRAGIFNNQQLAFSMGYDMKLVDSWHMSMALWGGLNQKNIDVQAARFDEQFANTADLFQRKVNYSDVGFGLMWYYNPIRSDSMGKVNAFMGLSGYHINTPNQSFLNAQSNLPRKFSYQGGVKITGRNKFDLSPNLIINSQGDFQEILPGFYVDYRFNSSFKISSGFWLRKNGPNAILLSIEHKQFALGYSYDMYFSSSMSKYSNTSPNSNQIAIIYKYGLASKKGINYNPTPFHTF